MSERTKVFSIYLAVALLSAGIIGTAMWLRRGLPEPDVVRVGRAETDSWFDLERDLEAVNQAGERVKLSDLRGKVWVVAEFFAVCPKCAVRNGSDLRAIYDEFGSDPGFHMVCISVDPEADNVERLAAYAAALGADVSNWWFVTGEKSELHGYLSGELKFLDIRERKDPAEVEQLGRYSHDLGVMVVDRSWRVIGKRDLSWAREEGGPELYQEARDDVFRWIRAALAKPGVTGAAEERVKP